MTFTQRQWHLITDLFTRSVATSMHCAVATVNPDGSPHLAPIGSFVLLDNGTGLFFDGFLGTTERNLRHDPRISVLAVDSSRLRWLKVLATGRFRALPAIRLTGTAGARRQATPEELDQFRRRVRWLRRLKGHDLLWGNLRFVHDVTFDTAAPVQTGALTKGLWPKTVDADADGPAPTAAPEGHHFRWSA